MPSSPHSPHVESNATPQDATPSPPQPSNLAFLVHSPDTVRNNLPPDVDNKPLARQKRRRTSKEDEDVLKAEYEKNPKPDKATRLDIVSKVALGEKEVQIWFQNRRQNDRRRSGPSQTFELMTSCDQIEASMTSLEGQSQTAQYTSVEVQNTTTTEPDATQPESQETTTTTITAIGSDVPAYETPATEPNSSQAIASSQDSQVPARPTSYLANRRSASFVRIHEDPTPEPASRAPVAEAGEQTPAASRTLGRSRSFMRLRTNEDGQATVVTGSESPSPPRSQPTAPAPRPSNALRRSVSAAGLDDRYKLSMESLGAPKVQRTAANTLGRSRDSRAWEFWCDSEARNSLTAKADQEGSGSAADAIQLIRSNSRGALRSLPNKRNATLSRHSSAKHGKSSDKIHKPSLARSTTSQGRLPSQVSKKAGAATKSKKPGKEGEEFEILQTDSDKENWSPEPPNSQAPRQRSRNTQSSNLTATSRRILGENTTIMSQSNSLNALMAREQREDRRRSTGKQRPNLSQRYDSENVNPEDDDEIAAFMGAARPGSEGASVSSGEELAGVQGLLKLSQGNWGRAS